MNIQISVTFLHINNESSKKDKKLILFIIFSKNNKIQPGINLIKEMSDLSWKLHDTDEIIGRGHKLLGQLMFMSWKKITSQFLIS